VFVGVTDVGAAKTTMAMIAAARCVPLSRVHLVWRHRQMPSRASPTPHDDPDRTSGDEKRRETSNSN
jgi:hypothetical protein